MNRVGGRAFTPAVTYPPGGSIGEIRAEWCAQVVRALPPGPIVYRLPRIVRGRFWYFNEGKHDLTICGNPAGTILHGQIELGASEPRASNSTGIGVSSAAQSTVVTNDSMVGGSGSYFYLSYERGLISEAAYESSSPNPSPSGGRRNYGFLALAEDVDNGSVTLSYELDRAYESYIDDEGNYWLRFTNVNNFVSTNLVIKDVSIEGDGFLGTGLKVSLCHGVTIENVKVKRFFNDGIVVSRCRDVTVQDCEIRDIGFNPFTSGSGYGVAMSQSHFVTVQRVLGDELRYVATVFNGSSDVMIRDLKALRVYNQLADIHGGDCLRVTFQDLDFGDLPVAAGNGTWRRGARDVTFERCNVSVMGFVGSIRKATVTDCKIGRMVLINTTKDNGNNLMNATGAGTGFTNGLSASNSVLKSTRASVGGQVINYPLQFVQSNAVAIPTLFQNIQFSECTLEQAFTSATHGIVTAFGVGDTASNDVYFTNCEIKFGVGGLGFMYAIRSTSHPNSTGKIASSFTNCNFTRFAASDKKLIQGGAGVTFDALFKCCKYIDPGTSEDIKDTNVYDFVDNVNATVEPC